ncbi:MAG: hypothetical protein IJU35_04975 [Paludibacteraceae bacterium]|nr:hypothetical protein [Paludibacteraceae bacterium]
MKKFSLIATMVAMSLAIAMPINAQSRKDKKNAKKVQWEMLQQQQKEEAELRHQMKMDSLKNVQREKDEAKAKAALEQEKQAAKQAQREAEEEQIRKMNMVAEMPCQTYDDADWFYATGVKRFKASQTNLTPTTLLRSTRQQLLQKLQGKYQQVIDDYFDQMETEDGEYARQHIESAGRQVIQQLINETYEVCRKQTQLPDAEGFYTMYMAIKVSKKDVVEKVVDTISHEQEMQVRFNEKQFRDSAFKVFEENK